jgi:hypothetical protein
VYPNGSDEAPVILMNWIGELPSAPMALDDRSGHRGE